MTVGSKRLILVEHAVQDTSETMRVTTLSRLIAYTSRQHGDPHNGKAKQEPDQGVDPSSIPPSSCMAFPGLENSHRIKDFCSVYT